MFFIPAVVILGLGLKALGRSEKMITLLMVLMLLVLVGATLLFPTTDFSHLLEGSWAYMVPVFNLVVFIYCAQYIVPEIARGLSHQPKQLPRAIVTGMVCTFGLLALVPLSVISLNGLENISQVATISWGKALGSWAFFTANGFALFAMLTSYWGIGGSFLTNIADRFSLPVDTNLKVRLLIVGLVALPPFALAYSGMVGFVDALYFVGVFSGVVLSILPFLIVHGARKLGNKQPEWQCPAWMTRPVIYIMIFLLYSASAVYAVLAKMDLLPAGW
ncbi:MAG: aromatic amino acid transport family protein [Neisseria sp.]|uniref:aromatic amino acid transport family protein n=1 Tax=Neisseria sp. TaxID=192066 RepID=UPI0026DD3CF9|nr:aromatic amino acid transport family protein [Neisseria sp.]MDO4641346.1 aromatic amino acid transport family protein [Neisseria sp.]